MADSQPQQKRGCLFYIGVIAAVLVVVFALGAIFGIRYAHQMVGQLTDKDPVPLPTTQLPEAQMFELKDRVDTFRDAVKNGEPAEPLELSADELNALIATDPAFASLKNHLYVIISSNQLSAKISFPAEDLGLVRLRGRYVNADGLFEVRLTNDQLEIRADLLKVKGKLLPRNIMREIARENLADRFNQDPRASAGLRKLKAIEVKDGKLVIVPKK